MGKIACPINLALVLLALASCGQPEQPLVSPARPVFGIRIGTAEDTGKASLESRTLTHVDSEDIQMTMGVMVGYPSIFISSRGSSTIRYCELTRNADGSPDNGETYLTAPEPYPTFAVLNNSRSPTRFYAAGDDLSGTSYNEIFMMTPTVYGGGVRWEKDYLINFIYRDTLFRATYYSTSDTGHYIGYPEGNAADFSGVRYICFVPAAVVGTDFTYVLGTEHGQKDSTMTCTYPSILNPAAFPSAEDWIADPYSKKMSELVTAAVANNPSIDRAAVTQYFYSYVRKFTSERPGAQQGIDFFSGISGNPTNYIPDDSTLAPFLFVGLNADIDLSEESGFSTLEVAPDYSKTIFQYDDTKVTDGDGTTHDTLYVYGMPPVNFVTSVIRSQQP